MGVPAQQIALARVRRGLPAKAFLRILLALSSILFALLIGEVITRYQVEAWPFDPPLFFVLGLTAKDQDLRWRFSGEGLNSLGLRNEEVLRNDHNHIRILFLGDSLVWSGETSSKQLYTEVMERNLNESLGGAHSTIEVINAGIPGYTTYQELEFLKAYGVEMEPDVVLLGFVFNDVYYKYLHRPNAEKLLALDPSSRLHRFDTRRFPQSLLRSSYLAHEWFYSLDTVFDKATGSPYFPFEHRSDFYLAWKHYGWDDTRELIKEMKDLLAQEGTELGVVIFPLLEQVTDKYLNLDRDRVLYPQKRITTICNEYNIPYLDLTGAIHQAGPDVFAQDGIHLRNKGNDLVASEVTSFLLNKSRWRFKLRNDFPASE